jgi:hypothetical protein
MGQFIEGWRKHNSHSHTNLSAQTLAKLDAEKQKQADAEVADVQRRLQAAKTLHQYGLTVTIADVELPHIPFAEQFRLLADEQVIPPVLSREEFKAQQIAEAREQQKQAERERKKKQARPEKEAKRQAKLQAQAEELLRLQSELL